MSNVMLARGTGQGGSLASTLLRSKIALPSLYFWPGSSALT